MFIDFFLGGYLKSKVYTDKSASIQKLKLAVIKKGTLWKIIDDFKKRWHECKNQNNNYLYGVLVQHR